MTSPTSVSHTYELPARALLRFSGKLLAGLVVAVVLVHLLAALPWLPEPTPPDLDRVVIQEKARLAAQPSEAAVLLLGDSSCMMDIDAIQLADEIGRPVVNLGTLSYLSLDAHAALLSQWTRTHPQPPSTVVLLMHPDSLRRSESVREYDLFLRRELARHGGAQDTDAGGRPWNAQLGSGALRERIAGALVPSVLGGAFGTRYGTTWEAARYLRKHRGSMVDPSRYLASVEGEVGEHRLASGLEQAGGLFRQQVPPTARLLVAFTPLPVSATAPDQQERLASMRLQFANWLGADVVLISLPAVMPDALFATRTHLNAEGAAAFTSQLASALKELP